MPVYPVRDRIPKQAELERLFKKQRIRYTKPGFQDSEEFTTSEAKISHFLESYADYVSSRALNQQYEERARLIAPQVTRFIYDRVVESGRLGACIDASMTLSRILEAEGIWNFLVKGALTITYSPQTGFTKHYLQALMDQDNSAKAGHVWVCAPPFRVIDVTMSLQENTPAGAEKYLPPYLIEEQVTPAEVDLEDLAQKGFCSQFENEVGEILDLAKLYVLHPRLKAALSRFGVFEVRKLNVSLKYCCCATTACDTPFERMKTFCVSGKYPWDLYNDYKLQ
jgi:hypothetical protein